MSPDTATDRQKDTQTDRHIHADENNTCPKTKFLGQVIKVVAKMTYTYEGHRSRSKSKIRSSLNIRTLDFMLPYATLLRRLLN